MSGLSDVELLTLAESWEKRASQVQVIDQASYDSSSELLKIIKSLRAEAEAHHRPTIDAANRTHKAALAALARVDGPLVAAENYIKSKVAAFLEAEDKKVKELQRQAEIEALNKHQELIETQRRARQLELEQLARQKEEELERQIAEMEAAGADPATVAAAINASTGGEETAPPPPPPPPVFVAPPVIKSSVRTNSGATKIENWEGKVVNLIQLLEAAVLLPEAYVRYINVNTVALNQEARRAKDKFDVPGCEAMKRTGVSTRR